MKVSEFLSENFHFLVVKFSVYSNRPVFFICCFVIVYRNSPVDTSGRLSFMIVIFSGYLHNIFCVDGSYVTYELSLFQISPSFDPREGYAITKTHLYNFDPRKPHFYVVKLGFTGVYIIVLISAQKHRLWVPVRTASTRRF